MQRARSGRGFSLVELLITVAIIAALAGTIVLTFFDYVHDARVTKSRGDLDSFVSALQRHDQFNLQLTGGRLDPLLGRYLRSLPPDPWGNPYIFDGNLGVLGSFGADGVEGGMYQDKDLVRFYKAPLSIIRAQYGAAWGQVPDANTTITLTFNKPIALRTQGGVPAWNLVGYDVVIIRDPASFAIPLGALGFTGDEAASSLISGLLVLRCTAAPTMTFRPKPSDRINLSELTVVLGENKSAASLLPADTVYLRLPEPVDRTEGLNLGVTLEKE